MFAAAPDWFAENVSQISLVTLLVLVGLVVRIVQKLALRLALLGVIVVVGVLIYANRGSLETCAKTCSCELAGESVSLPLCSSDLKI